MPICTPANSRSGKTWKRVTKIYLSICAQHCRSQTPVCSKVYVLTECVFRSRGKTTWHCLSMLMWMESVGDGGCIHCPSSTSRSFAANCWEMTEGNFNFFFKGQWGIPVSIEMLGCACGERQAQPHLDTLNDLSGWPWEEKIIARGKERKSLGGSKAVNWILLLEGLCVCVC